MYFDRFDILTAHYQFGADYHSGQGSELYARSCRAGKHITLSPLWRGFESLSENGQEIYRNLMERFEV